MHPLQILFKNEFEAKTFPFRYNISHWDYHFPNYWKRFLSPVHLTGWSLLEYYIINILGLIISTVLWEGIRTYAILLQNLIKSEKLQMVSHLAASISHEVRNPLTVTRGFIQLLYEDISSEKKREYVSIALQELDRATDIISDYLTFAKPTVEKSEKININEEIQQAINVICPLSTMNGVEIEQAIYDLEQNQFLTIGERKKFQQCLINIMKNGIESMKSKGGKASNSRVWFPRYSQNCY